MKTFATLILAAAVATQASFAFAAVGEPAPLAGQAAPYEAMETPAGYDGWAHPRRHHSCIGLAQGTAHASCGSLTGGPSGGLH